jgi:hypothetical protein
MLKGKVHEQRQPAAVSTGNKWQTPVRHNDAERLALLERQTTRLMAIEARRRALNLPRQTLCTAAGVSLRAYEYWLASERLARPSGLTRLERQLGQHARERQR